MSPNIPDNSYLIFHHFIRPHFLKVGKIIKVQHPIYGLIVKKITGIDQKGCYWLEGMNINSISSSKIGTIDITLIVGIVFYEIKAATKII